MVPASSLPCRRSHLTAAVADMLGSGTNLPSTIMAASWPHLLYWVWLSTMIISWPPVSSTFRSTSMVLDLTGLSVPSSRSPDTAEDGVTRQRGFGRGRVEKTGGQQCC